MLLPFSEKCFWIKERNEQVFLFFFLLFLLLSILRYSSVLSLNSRKVGLNTVEINQGFNQKYIFVNKN